MTAARGRVRTTAVVTALCGALAAAITGCETTARGGSGDQPVVIRAVTSAAPDALDPAAATGQAAYALLPNIYQTLLTIGPNETTPTPDAAECQYDTPTTYACTVKNDQTFHNGHPLTASDVKFTFDRLRRLKRVALFANLASVAVRDEQTVVFTLRSTDATFPYALATPVASLVDEELFGAGTVLSDARVVGSGPYQVATYDGKRLVLERYAGYRGVRPRRNDRVEIALDQTPAALAKAVRTGTADVASGALGPNDLRALHSSAQSRVTTVDAGRIGYWAFHLKSASGRRPAVRRAVARLVDRRAIADTVYGGQVSPSYSLLPKGFSGHSATFRDSYGESPDRAKAAAVLRGAGLKVPVPITVGWTPRQYGPRARLEAEELRRQLAASGLFTVTLVRAEWPAYDARARAGAYDLFHRVRTAEHTDGDTFVSAVLRPGGVAVNGYTSATVDRLIATEIAVQGRSRHDSALGDVQRQITDDLPLVPVWQGRASLATGPAVDGMESALGPLYEVHYGYLSK